MLLQTTFLAGGRGLRPLTHYLDLTPTTKITTVMASKHRAMSLAADPMPRPRVKSVSLGENDQ